MLVLAACGTDDDTAVPDPDQDVDVEPDEDPDLDPDDEADPPEEGTEPEDDLDDETDHGTDDGTDDEATEEPDDATEDDDAELLLDGEPSTETAEADGEFGDPLAVTDVRVGTHDGFDRVVFELEGEGSAGWHVRYEDEPTSQGSGEPIDVEGEAALAVAIHNVTLPPELPEDIEPWDGPLAGPEGGVITQVVSDTIFEGIHTFVVGADAEYAFLVERFEDPQRVVIDLVHDG